MTAVHDEDARQAEVARREQARQQRKADLIARRAEVAIEKAREKAERAEQERAEAERLEAERRETARVARVAFDACEQVRGRLERMRHAGPDAVTWTAAERQIAEALEPLRTAPPEAIAELRRWCEPLGGARAADYDAPSPELTVRLKRDHRLLRRQVGSDLFVPEPRVLGAFGIWRDGDFYNEDTIRSFSTLVALKDGAILDTCRRPGRRLVWEIGGGWGGFAYQFKTICPNVTYLITGMPESWLLSAVYLMALFPHARFRFHGDAPVEEVWAEWETTDFVFVPEGAIPDVRPPRLDLVLDLGALPLMGATRIAFHVRRAFDWGAPYFYSLLPAGAPAALVESVWGRIAGAFWPHPVPPRAENIPPVTDGPAVPIPGVEYAHLIGWRRLRA